MIKKSILLLLNIIILAIAVSWYISNHDYEPSIVVISTISSIISVLSFSGSFSSGFNDISKAILRKTEKEDESINNKTLNDIAISSKKFDSLIFHIKKITKYITIILISIAVIKILIVSSELREMSDNDILMQLEHANIPIHTEKTNKEYKGDIRISLTAYKLFNNKYSLIFLLLALLAIMINVFFLDMMNKFIYSSYSKRFELIKNEDDFIKECKFINSELINYSFKNKDIPEILKLSMVNSFSNLYLNNIK